MNRAMKLFRIMRSPTLALALGRYRVAAAVEHFSVLAGIGCRTVVDIGANRGQFSLAAREVFPDAQIIAFEPLAAPATTYQRVFNSDRNSRLCRAAIGVRSERTEMHVSARDDSSSLLKIGHDQSRIFPGTHEVGTVTVEVRRLEDELEPDQILQPAMLKLDVQGFELEALRGCETLISHFAWVYCECSFFGLYEKQALAGEVIAWLQERGFHLKGVYNVLYDVTGKAVQGDFLFSRKAG